jgi:hypothetical protein
MTLFETETMAELCAKQGQIAEALAIYRRLVVDTSPGVDGATRARRLARLAELESKTTAPTLTMPAAARVDETFVRVHRQGEALTFSWALPLDVEAPALQVFLARRGAQGVETETRTVRLGAARGTTRFDVPALVSVRAAVGRLDGERFVPMALLPDGPA